MDNPSFRTSQHGHKGWCPENMKHSHIGEFIDYLQGIIEIKEECYVPLIKEYYVPRIKTEEWEINKETQFKKLLSAIEETKVNKADKQQTFDSPIKQKREEKTLEEAKKELEEAKKELEEAEEKLITFCENNSDYFYELLHAIDKKSNIELAVKPFLLRLFNHLAISILKAEYLLFDNYSDILSKITGFEYEPENSDIAEDFKIKHAFENPKETINIKGKDTIIPLFQYIDRNVIQSVISSVWYLIEICKTIDHKLSKNKFNTFFQVVNSNRSQRINAIFPIHGEKELIDKEIIDLFELSMESILDLTLIDHYFCYTSDNFDKLVTANERMRSLRIVLTPPAYNSPNVERLKEIYNFEDSFKEDGKGNSLDDFLTIKNIVEIKSKLLLKQLKESFDKDSKENPKIKKFNEQFDFLFYGRKNKEYAETFDEYIYNSRCFDFNDTIEYNKYTTDFLEKEKKEINTEGANFSFLIKYNKEQRKECEKCDVHDKQRCKNHCAAGKCNTKRDIIDFNECSKIAMDNFNQNARIINKLKDNLDLIYDDHSQFENLLKEIKNTLFEKDIEGFDDKNLQRLKLDPTNLTHYIKFFKSVLENLIKDIEKEEHHENFQKKIRKNQ